ncbi:DUF484 family protein [Pontibacter sp. JAM-7]|uniref:DUF484 family protein n=1 Tax=Pontibacter sp. JAM-7 TaxID=3366581 RepID=UPI003AF8F458
MMNSEAEANTSISPAQVAEYLLAHPDFFVGNSRLLEVLQVPHETGRAVSLVERQTSMLRERNQDLSAHLSDMIEVARYNDVQFEKTKRMVLGLLEAENLDDIAIAIDESLCQDFHSDITSLVLFTEAPLAANNLQLVPRNQAAVIDALVSSNLPCCGQLTEVENQFIFQDHANKVKSAAVVPLVQGETLGLLAIGSFDPSYFQSSQGTVLLSYVGEVLSRIVSRVLHQVQ